MAATLSILIFLSSFCTSLVLSAPSIKILPVPSGGPESIIFDPAGGFYTGVNDGRIVKYRGSKDGFVDFAYASPNRTKEVCEGTSDASLGNICGRTLGLGLHYKTWQLYLADTYHGLGVVGRKGGLAKQLVASVDGLPLKWLDGLDVDQRTGYVYFTDVSTVYNFSQVAQHIATGDSTGRVIEYNPYTKKSRVLLTGLKGVGGVGVAKDSSFVFITEFTGNRITKYWLKGPKKDTAELLLNITSPANVKLTPQGDFWIAVNLHNVTSGIRIDENAKILEQVSFYQPYNGAFAQEVHPHRGKLYISSFQLGYAGIYKYSKLAIEK